MNAFLKFIGWTVVMVIAVVMTAFELVIKIFSAGFSIVCVLLMCFIAPLVRVRQMPDWMGEYVEYSLKIQRWDITWAVTGYYRNWLGL